MKSTRHGVDRWFQRAIVRYLFAALTVAMAFGIRLLLIPVTGTGAPFVLFFAAVTLTSLLAGSGPGICSVLISIPVAAWAFVVSAGYTPEQAVVQALLFSVDGLVVIYLTRSVVTTRRALENTNARLQRANEGNAQAARRMREVIELAPDAFFLADLDARFTDVNASACKMLGYERDELVGKTIFDIIPPEDAARLKRVKGELLAPGEVSLAEWVQLRKDGAPINVEVSSNILPGGRWQAFVRDISERKRLERELREVSERFRLAIDEAPIGMALVGLDGRFLRVNRALCEIVGYTTDELTALTFQAITHRDDLDADLALARRLADGEIQRYELEKRYLRKDGSPVDIMLHRSVVRGQDGAPLYYVVQMVDISERKLAERTSQRLATIIRDSNDAITTQDLSGRILAWNRGAERMYGYAEAEALDMNIAAIVPRGNTETLAYLDAIRQGGKAASLEVKRRAKDGRILDVWLTVAPLVENGRPVAVATTERDITERRRREHERQRDLDAMERLHRVASLFLGERAPHAILSEILDAAIAIAGADFGNIQILDPASSNLEVVVQRNLPEAWLRYWAGVVKGRGACGTALAAGRRVVVEDVTRSPIFAGSDALEVQLKAGIRAVQSTPLVSRAGKPIGMVSTHWKTPHRVSEQVLRLLDLLARQAADIIERVQSEAALKLSEAKSSGILSISADALISIDGAQRITMFNAGAEKIFGYSKAEMIGAPLELLIPERLRAMHARHVESFAKGGTAARRMGERGATIVGLRKNGEEFPADAAISKLEVDGASVLTVALRDITEQKLREMEIRHAVQARDQVLSFVAHDLRNPLTAIMMQSKVMQRSGPEPDRRNQKPVEMIARAAARMNRLIRDLLDVTRIESGKLPLERAPLSVDALAGEAVEMQRDLAISASLDLQLDLPTDLPEIWGDRDRLLQVFENLIGNAIKFTPSGGCISVGAAIGEHEVLFSVKDTGAGIAAESVPHIFDRFWQAASNARRLGAGLGLPITKGIVEAHGGRIWVESAPGQGTCFYFSIPTGRPEGDSPSYVIH